MEQRMKEVPLVADLEDHRAAGPGTAVGQRASGMVPCLVRVVSGNFLVVAHHKVAAAAVVENHPLADRRVEYLYLGQPC